VKTFLGQVGENVGYGQAINRLLIHIGHNDGLYIFANDDVILSLTTIQELVNSYDLVKKVNTKVGPISPMFGPKNQFDYTEGAQYVMDGIRSVGFTPGAFWLVDENFLCKIGGFHPYFFMYGEDRELLNRSIQSGFTPYQIESCAVVHDFDYPPKSIELRRNYHENTMATVIISPSSDHRVLGAFKGLVLDAIKYKRFYEVIEISLALIRVLSQYSKLKMQQVDVNNQTRYRFLS
jgi:GT2 family glycosyltransferase